MKREEKPKERPNHPDNPGERKSGRMNASEPLRRLALGLVAGRMVNQDGNNGSVGAWVVDPMHVDTGPRSKEGIPSARISVM